MFKHQTSKTQIKYNIYQIFVQNVIKETIWLFQPLASFEKKSSLSSQSLTHQPKRSTRHFNSRIEAEKLQNWRVNWYQATEYKLGRQKVVAKWWFHDFGVWKTKFYGGIVISVFLMGAHHRVLKCVLFNTNRTLPIIPWMIFTRKG